MSSDLSPAGSSSYSSNTLHVGDGTWDNGRDDFLLPNLVGLNFATMQYNGMGNRFAGLPEYHRLITGHGVIAAITFLAIVPAAVFIAKFYTANPMAAVKYHVYLQILTVFLLTVVLVLGWMAVGPERALTNPHHGIGVTIYVLVIFQFIYGWIMGRIEMRRRYPERLIRPPTIVWLHKLLGRSIGLLGIIQIALGLTLYGSPKTLFILYALWCAILLFMYIALDRVYFEKRKVLFGLEGPEFYSDGGSYASASRTDYRPPPPGAPPIRERVTERDQFARNLLAGAGALGAYEWWQNRRRRRREDHEETTMTEEERIRRREDFDDEALRPEERMRRREEREQAELDAERRARPPPGLAPSGTALSVASSRPPPGVSYGSGSVPSGPGALRPPPGGPRTPSRIRRAEEDERLSPESWEDEKYEERPVRTSWRDRLIGAGAGIAAFEGARRLFGRRRDRVEEDYIEDDRRRRPGLGGDQNVVSQTDISRVEAGQTPLSPNDPRARRERMNIAGVEPMTPGASPSRPPRRARPGDDTLSYDEEDDVFEDRPQRLGGPPPVRGIGLWTGITTLGLAAGVREWSKQRRERNEQRRADRIRQDELDEVAMTENRPGRNSVYPNVQPGPERLPSNGTLLTGASGPVEPGHAESSRFGEVVDTTHPPLPAAAGAVPSTSGVGMPPSTVGPSISQQRVNEAYVESYPPPPPGPPPGGVRPTAYVAPEPGTLRMPQGAVTPDPSRLLSSENVVQQSSTSHPIRDVSAGALFGAAAADLASGRRRGSQSESPSRHETRYESRTRVDERLGGRTASGSVLEAATEAPTVSDNTPASPTVRLSVRPHENGRHMTFRRLNEQEAENERATRRLQRRERRRRSSEVSSGGLEDDLPPGSNARYRRNGNGGSRAGVPRRSSADQPITNIPPLPPMSSTAGSHRPPSELNLPPPPRPPTHSASPQEAGGLSSPPPPALVAGSGMTSPGDAGTGTDVSAFADNRRRRRAERARRLEAARGTGGNGRGQIVEFE